MVRFPVDRVYRKQRFCVWRIVFIMLLLVAMFVAAWFYGVWTDERQPVPMSGQRLYVVDGDSLSLAHASCG